MITYMGLMGILKQTALTSFVFSILQFGAVLVLIYHLFRIWVPKTDITTHIMIGMVVMLYLVSAIIGEGPLIAFQLLAPSYHCGFFINSLMAMIAGMHYLRKGKIIWLIVTGLVAMLASLSDRLFLIAFMFPLIILVILTAIRDFREYRYFLLLGVTLISSLLGMWIFKLLYNGTYLHFIATGWKMFNFANIGTSFHNLVDHIVSIIKNPPLQRWLIILMLFFFIAAPVYLSRYLLSFLKNRLDQDKKQQYMLILFLFIYSVAILLTPVINGAYLGPAHIRYNYPAYYLGPVGSVYLLSLHLRGLRYSKVVSAYFATLVSFGLILFLIFSGIKNHVQQGVREFIQYYPEKSQILDQLKDTYGLKYGIANYWNAKHSTIFSRNDVRVYSVHDVDLKPYYHVINENWYHDGGKGKYADPVFNFIYADAGNNTKELLLEHFGHNLDTIYAKGGAFVIKLPEFKIDRTTREMVILDQDELD